jgi:hypothetical protein
MTALAVLWLGSAPAEAQLARTFVSSGGNDSSDCSRFAPCRTFQAAHDKTFDQGEVSVLDTGGYGALTITKSISLVSEVGEASILVSGGATGITINAPPSAYVNLRGITIQGIGFGGGDGLVFHSGFALTMENCVVRNHTHHGISFRPPNAGTYNLAISNTLVADNGGIGILIGPNGASGSFIVRAALSRVEAYHNSSTGLWVDGANNATNTIKVTAADSVFANNLTFGVAAEGFFETDLALIRSVVANNATGLTAGFTATLSIGQSAITGNAKTWDKQGSAILQSFGDNYVINNADGDPALPTIPRK